MSNKSCKHPLLLSSQEAQQGQGRLQREVGPEKAEKPLVVSRQSWTTQLRSTNAPK